jgi:hypothetical protein
MSLYCRWISAWEERLARKDCQRRVLPFEWGLEWLGLSADGTNPLTVLREWSRRCLAPDSGWLEPAETPAITLTGDRLRFESPLPGPHAANRHALARVWRPRKPPAEGAGPAVIVVPQWNAVPASHAGLCRTLAWLGMTAVRLTLPYHEERNPEGLRRADLMVSPNLGRTLHAVRQAVLEVLVLARWLRSQGYRPVGVMGTSLGSCVAYLAFASDPELTAGVFNHVSAFFADVVWQGRATRFVRWGLEGEIRLEELRECWAAISPWYYIDGSRRLDRPHLMITARYDTTFPPELSRLVFERYAELNLPLEMVSLPCGHYTTARIPFVYLDGWHICRFLRRYLAGGSAGKRGGG